LSASSKYKMNEYEYENSLHNHQVSNKSSPSMWNNVTIHNYVTTETSNCYCLVDSNVSDLPYVKIKTACKKQLTSDLPTWCTGANELQMILIWTGNSWSMILLFVTLLSSHSTNTTFVPNLRVGLSRQLIALVLSTRANFSLGETSGDKNLHIWLLQNLQNKLFFTPVHI